MRLRPVTVALLSLTLAVPTACGVDTDPFDSHQREDMSLEQQFGELMQRPNVDEIMARYNDMQTEIRDKLSAAIPLDSWQVAPNSSYISCNDFPAVHTHDVKKEFMDRWYVDSALTADQWRTAVSELKAVGARWGFTDVGFQVEKNDYREIRINDGYGAKTILSTGGPRVILSVDTGCHLTTKAKQRGTPLRK